MSKQTRIQYRKFLTIIITLIFAVIINLQTTSNALSIGTKIGDVLSTDIIATIDQKPIPSMNIKGYTAIVVEDLRAYGFDVVWNHDERSLHVTRNLSKPVNGKEFTIQHMIPGSVLNPVLHTNIKTFLDGQEIISFNIDGQTAMYFNQLNTYGTIQWSENTRVAAFDFPVVQEPTVVIKDAPDPNHRPQVDQNNTTVYHQQLNKNDIPEYIRVGLYFDQKALPETNISSEKGFVVGEFHDDIFNGIFKIDDTNQLKIRPDNNYYIGLSAVQPTASQAQEFLKVFNSEGIIRSMIVREEQGWNVYVGPYVSLREAEDSLLNLKLDKHMWKTINRSDTRMSIENRQGNPTLIYHNNAPLYIKDLSINVEESVLQIEGVKYRGTMTALRHDFQRLTIINKLSIEQYLYGVVPKEMSYSWPSDALKAQAVSARGFAWANMGKYSQLGFDVCNTVNSQVYGGLDSEHDSTNLAVDETNGLVMTKSGELVIPYYHANSGGRTESSENVWNEALSYARGVNDPFSIDAKDGQWVEKLSFQDVETKLMQHQMSVGSIIDMMVMEVSPNGRVMELMILGSHGSHSLNKQESRWLFGLKSNYYEVSMDSDGFIFFGNGYGHGVGMSQHGARVMAESGYKWQEILAHYFTGVRIE